MDHFGLYYRMNDLAFGMIEPGLQNNAKSKLLSLHTLYKNYITVINYH